MRLEELAFQYNRRLNPKLWDSEHRLDPEVKVKLFEIAAEFIKYMDIDLGQLELIITGSSANYNWTDESDIDLHVVIDKQQFENQCPLFTEDFFSDKKTLWNEHHEIEIYGHPVELYVQDAKEQHIATGVYSLSQGKWLVTPTYDPPSIDEASVKAKTDQFVKEIDKVINSNADVADATKIKDRISKYRRAGLTANGEFSTENLVFKELRRNGYLGKLREYIRTAFSDDLSLY